MRHGDGDHPCSIGHVSRNLRYDGRRRGMYLVFELGNGSTFVVIPHDPGEADRGTRRWALDCSMVRRDIQRLQGDPGDRDLASRHRPPPDR